MLKSRPPVEFLSKMTLCCTVVAVRFVLRAVFFNPVADEGIGRLFVVTEIKTLTCEEIIDVA